MRGSSSLPAGASRWEILGYLLLDVSVILLWAAFVLGHHWSPWLILIATPAALLGLGMLAALVVTRPGRRPG